MHRQGVQLSVWRRSREEWSVWYVGPCFSWSPNKVVSLCGLGQSVRLRKDMPNILGTWISFKRAYGEEENCLNSSPVFVMEKRSRCSSWCPQHIQWNLEEACAVHSLTWELLPVRKFYIIYYYMVGLFHWERVKRSVNVASRIMLLEQRSIYHNPIKQIMMPNHLRVLKDYGWICLPETCPLVFYSYYNLMTPCTFLHVLMLLYKSKGWM